MRNVFHLPDPRVALPATRGGHHVSMAFIVMCFLWVSAFLVIHFISSTIDLIRTLRGKGAKDHGNH